MGSSAREGELRMTEQQRTVLLHLRNVAHRPTTWVAPGFLFHATAAGACVRRGWAIKRMGLFRITQPGLEALAAESAPPPTRTVKGGRDGE